MSSNCSDHKNSALIYIEQNNYEKVRFVSPLCTVLTVKTHGQTTEEGSRLPEEKQVVNTLLPIKNGMQI